jgi:hypothetical protein
MNYMNTTLTTGFTSGFICCNDVMFSNPRDSGCSLICPDPSAVATRYFISSVVVGILFRDLLTISDSNFLKSGG